MSASFSKLATTTASTKRAAYSSGKFTAPVTSIASLSCTPLVPVQQRTVATAGLETPVDMFETYVQGGLDIVAGDILLVGSIEYNVVWVGQWYWRPAATNTLQLVVQRMRGVAT
jgi:hypothetical protein